MSNENLLSFDVKFSNKQTKAFFRSYFKRFGRTVETTYRSEIEELQKKWFHKGDWKEENISQLVINDANNRLDNVDLEDYSFTILGSEEDGGCLHLRSGVMISSPAGGSDGVVCEGNVDFWKTLKREKEIQLLNIEISAGFENRLFILTEDERAIRKLINHISRAKEVSGS